MKSKSLFWLIVLEFKVQYQAALLDWPLRKVAVVEYATWPARKQR